MLTVKEIEWLQEAYRGLATYAVLMSDKDNRPAHRAVNARANEIFEKIKPLVEATTP